MKMNRKTFGLILCMILFLSLLSASLSGFAFAATSSSQKSVSVRSIKLNKSKATVAVNSTLKLTATVSPKTASNKDVNWSTSNKNIATVDSTGNVQILSSGSVVITATATDGSKKKATCKLTCKAFPVTSISLSPGEKALNVGESVQLAASFKPSNATNKTISSWGVADSSIASIDQNGKITAKKAGTTKVYAISTSGKKRAEATIRVRSGSFTKITISAVGDIVLGGDPNRGTEKKFADLLSQRNNKYSEFVKYVAPTLANDDLTIANLECSLTTAKSYDKKRKYVFRGKPEYAQLLVDANIEVVNLSNNHTEDFKSAGYAQTKKSLKNVGVAYNGINGSEPVILTAKGVKVGFIGFNSSRVSLSTMQSRIKALRQSCDVVVVSIHWTSFSEYVYTAQAGQKKIARGVIDAGADLVIGTHRHVLSGIEKYKGKHIVYDLGNFMVVGNPNDSDSFIFRQHFNVDTGYAEDAGIEVIPIQVSSDPESNNIQPIIASGAEATRILDKIKKHSSGLGQADF